MAPNDLRLFMAPSSCTTAAHILLLESGISFKTEIIDVFKGFPAEYLHLSPKGKVPILHADGETITEMPAIVTAIAQLAPDKHFLGGTNNDIVRSYEWFNFLSGEMHAQGYYALFRPQDFIDDKAAHDAIRQKSREKIARCYGIVEEKLKGVYAVGDAFSAADAYLLPFYRWGNANGFAMRQKYPKYTALMENLANRESVQSACEKEGINALSEP
ncbi:glutathione S-transferase [Plenodomus tracheiphilus IPT5]|uniref:Glutathione S-transferase n=1 Tax=Plenodomus tracheiphilus IPT5 TaxID=1408161 RepID=A0A6A7B2S0_9PLEO|nr:glutathione S-transferase [Plenodomus tracheiphilus IPT5]